MKLKIDKKFQPCEVDDDDEMFPNGIFVFNITKLIAHVMANAADFPVEEVAVNTLGLTSSNLDEPTVQNADLSRPIVLAEIAPGRYNVIDGNHRVGRARRDGVQSLPAYKVGPSIHYRFLTTTRGYKAYIEYWNEKATGMARLARAQARRASK